MFAPRARTSATKSNFQAENIVCCVIQLLRLFLILHSKRVTSPGSRVVNKYKHIARCSL